MEIIWELLGRFFASSRVGFWNEAEMYTAEGAGTEQD
jgi:hypothetical protein